MKYFAKYLPVEGEPTEVGDCYEIEKGSIGVILEKTCKPWRFRTRGLTGYFKNKEAPDNIISQKRVKLFLCSKDIQIGDKLKECNPDGIERIVHHFETVLPCGVYVYEPWPSEDERWIRADQAFKTIGEILTKGISEGDEFDDIIKLTLK